MVETGKSRDHGEHVIDVLFLILDIRLTLENSPVFQTQVGGQILALRQEGLRVSVLCTSGDAGAFEAAIGHRLRKAGVRVSLVEHGSLVSNLLRMVSALREERRVARFRRVYLRGIWGYLALRLAFPWRQPEHVYDVRGALRDEMAASGTPRWRARLYSALERSAISRARALTCVSHPLKDQLARQFHRADIEVIPSCVQVSELTVDETTRAERRKSYGFAADDVVLVYSGGLNRYQKIPEMLAIWARLPAEARVRFVLATSDQPHDGGVADTAGFGDRLVQLRLRHAEVPAMLTAADVGFMLRDNRPLNQVASPVKFAEYLAAGLFVVTSPGIGDISTLIERTGVGVVVDPSDPDSAAAVVRELIDRVRREREHLRQIALRVAREHYDWGAYRSAFRRLYGEALSGTNDEPACAAS